MFPEKTSLTTAIMNLNFLIPTCVIGAVVAWAVGYITYKATGGFGDFVTWFDPDDPLGRYRDAWAWGIGGIIAGGAVGFLRRAKS